MTLSREHYLTSLRRDGGDLAAAARGNLEARVPGCPEWNVADLVDHIGEVHRFWGQIAGGTTNPRDTVRESPPAPELVVEWYEEGLAKLVETLRTIDPDLPIWTWAPVANPTASWIVRRMTQETAVHRWDAQQATGNVKPIEAELASDGIDEILYVFLPAKLDRHNGGGETVHIHCTDVAGEWMVRLNDGGFEVTSEHGKGDAALRGPASDLLLALWGRIPFERVELIGDETVPPKLLAAIDRE
ncbi:MAG: maleylpyruvate isomerase family mycothiol-dependent enzyme [Actinomycetota bacterium]